MAAVEAVTQFLQDQVVIQHLELLLLLVAAMAERTGVYQQMAAAVAAAVSIVLVKESLLER
jgi:hypothetical protein